MTSAISGGDEGGGKNALAAGGNPNREGKQQVPVSSHPAEPRSERFTNAFLDGVKLHVLHRGRASDPKLVLLHGGGANAHWWDHLAPAFAGRHHVLALDFRGHGDSDYPETLAVGAFDRDLEALLEHIGDRGAILVGHSMGAHVALSHAARHRGLRAVIALEISHGGRPGERRRARLALAARRTYPSREEALRRFQFLPAAPGADEALRASIAENSVRREADGRFGFKFDAQWFTLPRATPPDLGRIACPVLVIRGAESGLLTPEGAAELVGLIPSARCVEIAGGGHNVHLERPGDVLATMEAFLHSLR
jgi:pimeloyl-ACP methyl ester carboxylesterase